MPNTNLVSGLGGAAGYGEITMPRGDDNTMAVDLSAVFEHGFLIDGVQYEPDEFVVSTNGFVQFGYQYGGVYPYTTHWIAPYNIDLDTRTAGSNSASGQVYVDIDVASSTVTVTWDQVGRYYVNGNPSFSFQMQMTQMTDGTTQISFRYGDMELDSLLRYARIGYSLDTRLDNPLDTTVTPEDFDTTAGNTGVPGVWDYLVNLQPIVGTTGRDTMVGTAAADSMFGLGGRDIMSGLGDDDTLDGGNGNDRLLGQNGDDVLIGGRGADTLNGGAGSDTAEYFGSRGIVVDLLTPADNTGDAAGDVFTSIENLTGGGGDDMLAGDGGANVLIGRGGDDTLLGRGGNDVLGGRNGHDTLIGGLGNDSLFGGRGNDTLIGGAGADFMDGGTGFDAVSYTLSTASVAVNLYYSSRNIGDAAGDTFFRIETIIGSGFDDVLSANNHYYDIRLEGGDGNDRLRGGSGNNTLVGGEGNDVLRAGYYGRDVLIGGDGNDIFYGRTTASYSYYDVTMLGGAGNDTFFAGIEESVIIGGTGQDEVSYIWTTQLQGPLLIDLANGHLNTGTAQGDVISDVENLTGSRHDDVLRGDGQANRILGLAGDDTLIGRGGNDRLEGRVGADVLDGGLGDDGLFGGDGIDTFVYGTGADVVGDFANDRLRLDDALWNGAVLTEAQILALATVIGGDTVFDFGGGNTLTLTGVTDLTLLSGQIDVF